ncbi:ABC transporter ATP-binding protein [Plesiomonas shigelloides]|uniref:ATP-binding protein Uup n=1 Tax=Plesiomonas shigelloides TaxID=703 RepID=A0A2P1VNB2_PLESH|nr:ABC transporter ATP-binding protein [Plesiomonas shigelloides]AVQ86639.1 ABC transporter ATP-binding protein [Plesiomonas shigelloides]KAB7658439.1 ABC transporter ATP-binding protein [Plesiomonas shigelloides]KAB7681245.1 ABC transporter ATP-binding protein [Plesiomonas shigelloides]KAB7694767.1 ABC transporter ATP-binding protein [Plesiomonas shigelloides]KAB7700676.1 ABC transporter ATP-binding protein [Plesiomonas shigelloides]
MALINLTGAYLSYSDAPLLDHTELHIEPNERVCLVGRNGAGKSTLMKVLAGEQKLDDGRLQVQQDVVVARLEQDPPRDAQGSVFDYVAEGVEKVAQQLKDYHDISLKIATDPSEQNLAKMARLQEALDHCDGWRFESRIHQVMEQLNLKEDMALSELSGGWLRKAALARALVSDPDVLLLDEPTNHLDVDTIRWLESFLKEYKGSIVFISHDRAFIRNMATRIVDLDRGILVSWPGDYDKYLEGKEEALRVEEQQNAEFDKRLAQEEVWIRQGIKARRTRNEGRVRALKALRRERAERREVMGTSRIQVDDVSRSGKIVFELENAGYEVDGKVLLKNFTTTIMRGDKIALVGPNGCGKTTLIKLLLGELQPTTGTVRCGTKLDVAYFDQYRAELDPEKTVMDNVAEGKQEVMVAGKPRHILGYLQDFLFHPRRAMTPVKALSGGERNRLLLAKLLLKPNNLLILDEPTNDLDIETLELLEELLAEYQGTLLLVSHDRQFVDNTVTTCWMFEGDGQVSEYVGGYHDSRQQQEAVFATRAAQQPKAAAKPAEEAKPVAEKPRRTTATVRLSYKQQRELDELPALLEQYETRIAELQAEVENPEFFQKPHQETSRVLNELAEVEQKLETAFERWEELENIKNNS